MAARSQSVATRRPRALVVDLWDTLTVPSLGLRDRLVADVAALLGVDPAAFVETCAATFPQRARGDLGDLRATLRSIAEALGEVPDDTAVDRAARRRLEVTAELMRFRDDALSTLSQFRRSGWLIGLVTDSSCDSEEVWAATHASRLVNVAVFSCVEGVSKPDPRLFEAVTRRLGVLPDDCAYVADGRGGELATAASLGMRAIRLEIEVEHDDAEDWPGEVIGRLGDLAALLLDADVASRC